MSLFSQAHVSFGGYSMASVSLTALSADSGENVTFFTSSVKPEKVDFSFFWVAHREFRSLNPLANNSLTGQGASRGRIFKSG
jgi:hypothetical protein